MPRLFLLCSLLAIVKLVNAQSPVFNHFKWYRVEDGLPQSFVSGVVQDKDGFIWAGTRDGLTRFDGRNFIVLRHSNIDSSTIRSNIITHLYKDPQNNIWIFYLNSDFDLLNSRLLKIQSFPQAEAVKKILKEYNASKFIRDKNGRFWITSRYNGIASYDPLTKLRRDYNLSNHSLNDNEVLGNTEGDNGIMYVFTRTGIEGISAVGTAANLFYPYNESLKPQFRKDTNNVVTCIEGKTLVMGDAKGLLLFDLITKKFRKIDMQDIPGVKKYAWGIQHLFVNKSGETYIVRNGGVYLMDKNFTIHYLWQAPNPVNAYNDIKSFFLDEFGVLWLGTNAAGLYKLNLEEIPFTFRKYNENFVADILGLLKGIRQPSLPASIRNGKNGYGFRYCYSPNGDLFFAYSGANNDNTNAHVYWYTNGTLKTLLQSDSLLIPIRGMCFAEGKLYTADRKGNIRIWGSPYKPALFLSSVLDLSANTGDVSDIQVAGTRLWVATEKNGLYEMGQTKVLRHFTDNKLSENHIVSNQLTDIFYDPTNPNILWIGTLGQGLIKWNTKGMGEQLYTTNEGLPNNTIYSIVADKENHYWISTNQGISRVSLQTNTFRNYDITDGLLNNEFNRFHHFRFPDGHLAFGSLDGITLFDPSTYKPDTINPAVVLTNLFINNQEISPQNNELLAQKGLNEIEQLNLPFNKNFLSAEFAAIEYNQPEKIRYRYQLEGYDKDWVYTKSNSAVYTRLPPGKYTLKINASNTTGQWSHHIRQLKVHILSPWWASWPAYLVYAGIVILLFNSYWRYHRNKIRMENEVALEKSKAEHLKEMDEIKSRFFANITHELRTPLTLILTPIEQLNKQEYLPAADKKILQTVQKNAAQLLRLINQLLDLSKIESGQMKINPKLGNIGLFTSNCVDLFMVNAKEKNIALHFSADNINDLILFDEEKWEKIIFNLVSNALKYTDPGGTVTVQLSYQPGDAAEPEKCLLSVTDTGRGIAQDQLERIFDRFYTINEDRQQSKQGTGIGLSLVSELAELMQGKVSVRSREGEGSFFEVWIPVKKAKSRQDLTEAKSRPAPVVSTTSLTDQKIILVAEDNEELRNFIADGLANRWKILTATNGRDAWDKTVNELPDIIISDLMMPGMDGAEFCRMVKNDMRTGHIGFIMLTARTAQESRYNSLESGADIYLTKPFHFEELEQRITNLLLQQERMRTHLIQHALPATPMKVVPHVNDIFIQQIQKILDEKIGDTKISVEMLATAMHLSQRTLHRKLKAILNISPVEFIKQYRLQKACVLLTSGHAITDTAYSVGFETASYFSQCFKEHFGKTPSEFALQQSA